MNWFKGTIPEAIVASRQQKCVFLVVVSADDDNSQQLLSRLEDERVSTLFNNFICISLKNGSVEGKQFSELYPVVVLPCIYMIGLQGTPLEVIGGLVDIPSLLARAEAGLNLHHGKENAQSSPQESAADVRTPESANFASSPQEMAIENSDQPRPAAGETNAELPLEVRVERANELLAALREKKEIEEREKEKTREQQRRELGKQLQKFKDEQKEREAREIAETRQKEKREEKEALEKIRQQIAQDRADRSARYHAAQASEEERRRAAQTAQEQLQQERASAARSAFARLQFRLPDGSTRTEQFASDVSLSQVAEFIDHHIQVPFKSYTICTTFPRREFQKDDMDKSLRELGLVPSAALLILPINSAGPMYQSSASRNSWLSSILAPLFWAWNWIWLFVFPVNSRRVTQISTVSPTQTQPADHGPVRRRGPQGNIRRLGDASADESDDNATWNGNSTQQL